MKILIFLLLLSICLPAQKYFIPIELDATNGRPHNNRNVDLYTAGTATKKYDLVYQTNSGGKYYSTTAIDSGSYDIYMDGVKILTEMTFSNEALNAAVQKTVDGDASVAVTSFATRRDSIGLDQLDANRKIINARDFGMLPSATAAANTAALQAAVDSAWSPATTDERGSVFIPAGNYTLAANASPASGHRYCVNIRNNVDIFGEGSSISGMGTYLTLDSASVAAGDSLVIFCDTGYHDEFVAKTGAPAGYWWHQTTIRGMAIDQNGDNQEGYVTSIGIWQPGETASIKHIHFRKIKGRGVWYNKPAPGLEMSSCSFFAADSADTSLAVTERVGVWHESGAGNFEQVSGDGLWPLHYITGASGYYNFDNNKYEGGNPTLGPQPDEGPVAFYLDSLPTLAGINITALRSDRALDYKGSVVEATGTSKPNISMDIIKHSGFKNLIKWTAGGTADSILTSPQGQGNYTHAFIMAPYVGNYHGNQLIDYDASGFGIEMVSDTQDTVTVLEYKGDLKLYIRSPGNTITFRDETDTEYMRMVSNGIFIEEHMETNQELRVLNGLRVGSTTTVEIDTIYTTGTANTDSLIIREGGREYFLERRDKP